MIKNLWNAVKVVCANHDGSTPDLVLTSETHKKLVYKCNCDGCNNTITVDDYDNIIKKISDKIEADDMEGIDTNLKNMKWKSKDIHYKIICFKNDKIVVTALNKRKV